MRITENYSDGVSDDFFFTDKLYLDIYSLILKNDGMEIRTSGAMIAGIS